MVVKRPPQQRVLDSCMSQKCSGLQSQLRFRNSQCSSNPVNVICIYFTRMPLVNFQNHSPFRPFSDSFLFKIRVKTWVEEYYIEKLHAIPT